MNPTRRGFLGGLAAALGAPLLVGTGLIGQRPLWVPQTVKTYAVGDIVRISNIDYVCIAAGRVIAVLPDDIGAAIDMVARFQPLIQSHYISCLPIADDAEVISERAFKQLRDWHAGIVAVSEGRPA